MKKKFISFLMAIFACTVLFSACTKENSDLIIGTWTNTDKTYFSDNGQQRFFAAGTYTWTFTEDSLIIVENSDRRRENTWTTAYTIDENHLIFSEVSYNVLELNKKSLIIELVQTNTFDGETYTYTDHLEFKKVTYVE